MTGRGACDSHWAIASTATVIAPVRRPSTAVLMFVTAKLAAARGGDDLPEHQGERVDVRLLGVLLSQQDLNKAWIDKISMIQTSSSESTSGACHVMFMLVA